MEKSSKRMTAFLPFPLRVRRTLSHSDHAPFVGTVYFKSTSFHMSPEQARQMLLRFLPSV